jgi:hypothetical protein
MAAVCIALTAPFQYLQAACPSARHSVSFASSQKHHVDYAVLHACNTEDSDQYQCAADHTDASLHVRTSIRKSKHSKLLPHPLLHCADGSTATVLQGQAYAHEAKKSLTTKQQALHQCMKAPTQSRHMVLPHCSESAIQEGNSLTKSSSTSLAPHRCIVE